jgi:cation transport ATPase
MKTSVIEVRDMLSVLSTLGVEKRIGEVPGVESVTVNYDAGSATVRYDETRLNIADIRSYVRQSGYEPAAPDAASAGDGHEGHTAPGAPGVPPATPTPAAPEPSPAAAPTSAAPEPAPNAAAAAPASAVPAGDGQKDEAAPDKKSDQQ